MKKKIDYKYWWTILYLPIYIMAFATVEQIRPAHMHNTAVTIDYLIPFNEWFIIPYLAWFPYIAIIFLLFFFKDKEEFIRMIRFMYAGMTVFIFISFLWPNGLYLRPRQFADQNLATWLVQRLYRVDTATNVFPSIHVYNSIVIAVAVCKSQNVIRSWWIKGSSVILSSLIIVSTVMLKQHSVTDVVGGFMMAMILYRFTYGTQPIPVVNPPLVEGKKHI